jgi:NAD(P)H dehydrogenase (quinone)
MGIGITGAGGQLGTGALRHVLSRTSPGEVVAITRHQAKIEEFSKQGVRVRAGDFNDPPGLLKAFDGIERLLIIPTADLSPGVRVRQHLEAIRAAVAAGVRHLIYVSNVGARPGPSDGILESHFATEQGLIGSAAAWTVLRMAPYGETLIDGAKRAATSGIYSAPAGAPAAYVVRDDVAATAAALLVTRGHENATYHATGPASLTQAEIAAVVARISGVPITFAAQTLEQFETGLAAAKLPPAVVNAITKYQRARVDGVFDLLTGDVGRLTGKPAESVVDFLARSLPRP